MALLTNGQWGPEALLDTVTGNPITDATIAVPAGYSALYTNGNLTITGPPGPVSFDVTRGETTQTFSVDVPAATSELAEVAGLARAADAALPSKLDAATASSTYATQAALASGLQSKLDTSAAVSANDATVNAVLTDATSASRRSFIAHMETARIVNRMTVLPTQGRQTLIRNLVTALVTAGVWDKLDGLYVMAAHDEQAGRLNWRSGPGQDLVGVNSPTFTTDRGFQGDGSTSHMDTQLRGNAADFYVRDSAYAAVWSVSNQGNSNWHDMSGAGAMYINSQASDANAVVRANHNSPTPAIVAAVPNSLGLTAWSRRGATDVTLYRNADVLTTSTAASVALGSTTFQLMRNATNYSQRRLAAAVIGSGLSNTEHAALYNALHTYLLAIGATT